MADTLEIPASDYVKLCAENVMLRGALLKIRDKLLEFAKECAECGGTGVITVTDDMQDAFGKALPCDACADLYELLE
jgi:hypothetical protein